MSSLSTKKEGLASDRPRRQLSLFDSVCIIVGIVIGAGIYETSPSIAANVPGVGILLLVWLCGGLIALTGAICYAELTTRYPQEGGDYVYLSKAFGRPVGFLYAWVELWIVRPGNIGAMGFVFARYFHQLSPAPVSWGSSNSPIPYAVAAVVGLTVLNILGVRSGKWTQNVLTTIKVAGLMAIVLVAFLPSEAPRQAAPTTQRETNLFLALIFVMFTYGGWKDMSCVAAEIRHPQKNILRALVLGTATITAIYLLVNLAFVIGLGFWGLVESDAAAAQLVQSRWGDLGRRAISALICVSALGSINGTVFAGSRIFYALGEAHPIYSWLGRWSPRLNSPVRALMLQTTVAVALIIGLGRYDEGFKNTVGFTAPFFSFFLFLVGIGLFVLRRRDLATPLKYRVLLYPLTPILFCASSILLFVSAIRYAFSELPLLALWVALAATGIGLLLAIGELIIARRSRDST